MASPAQNNDSGEQARRMQARADTAHDYGADVTMLVYGDHLRDATTGNVVSSTLARTGLHLFTRHIATIEGVDGLDLHVLKHLGASEGLNLPSPAEMLKYPKLIMGLDILPQQTELGPVTTDAGGAGLQPRTLVQAIIRTIGDRLQS